MTGKNRDYERLVRAFLRGQESWEALEQIGVKVKFRDQSPWFSEAPKITVTVLVEEIAAGFLALEDRPRDIQVWATIVRHSDLIDLEDRFETDPRADTLLEGIADAAFGETPEDRVFAVARELAVVSAPEPSTTSGC